MTFRESSSKGAARGGDNGWGKKKSLNRTGSREYYCISACDRGEGGSVSFFAYRPSRLLAYCFRHKNRGLRCKRPEYCSFLFWGEGRSFYSGEPFPLQTVLLDQTFSKKRGTIK